jgi:hypothetical protein
MLSARVYPIPIVEAWLRTGERAFGSPNCPGLLFFVYVTPGHRARKTFVKQLDLERQKMPSEYPIKELPKAIITQTGSRLFLAE